MPIMSRETLLDLVENKKVEVPYHIKENYDYFTDECKMCLGIAHVYGEIQIAGGAFPCKMRSYGDIRKDLDDRMIVFFEYGKSVIVYDTVFEAWVITDPDNLVAGSDLGTLREVLP